MGDLSTALKGGGIRERIGSHFTLANLFGYTRAAVHTVEMALLNYPISHRVTLDSILASLRKAVLRGNGIRQRDLIMPPMTLNGYHAGYNSGAKGGLDSDLEWFYRRSGTRYVRLGNLVSAGDTVCELDYREKKAVFRHGTSHELEPLLVQRGLQVSYRENNINHR